MVPVPAPVQTESSNSQHQGKGMQGDKVMTLIDVDRLKEPLQLPTDTRGWAWQMVHANAISRSSLS